jgi:hypothetical protein
MPDVIEPKPETAPSTADADNLIGDMPRPSDHADEIIAQAQTGGDEPPPRRRPGRPKGAKNKSTVPETPVSDKTPEQIKAGMSSACGALFAVATAIPAAYVHPTFASTPEERGIVGDAAADYLISKGYTDFPPGVALALAICLYFNRVIADPDVRSKISAHFNHRANRNGQNHVSQDNGTPSR